MSKAGDSPQTSDGIVIELWFREDKPDEWPDPLSRALNEIIQTDPVKDLDFIGLRLSSRYDPLAKAIVTNWEFLTLDGQPLGGKGASPANLTQFLAYLRLFYLSALRDSDDEFSPRSQFWGRILRDLKISEEQRKTLSEELAKLNHELLKADPRLEQVRATLDKIQKIMALGIGQKTSIQALPLKPWDLMSKAEIVIKARGSEVDFPLSRHGQGIQSLAVLFLFQAYIDVLLKPTFQPETEAILALEEPEAHLHPQATRALAANLGEVKSQKIVSSHSPYFIQEIPFTQIRMFRRNGSSSKILYIKRSFSVKAPNTPELLEFCKNNAPKFDYHEGTATLYVNGKMEEREYRKLLKIYPRQTDVHAQLKRLCSESQIYLSDGDLADLDTYAKRIRGEVLFARAWLLCEGQSEYLLLRYFAELLKTPLDQFGITIIDFQNNGSPGAFVGLARTFEIPWIMICDNDDEGKKFIKQVEDRGLKEEEIKVLVYPLPEQGVDLEMFLFKNGFAEECKSILEEVARSSSSSDAEWIIATEAKEKGKETRQIILKKDGQYEIKISKKDNPDQIITQADSKFQSLFADVMVAELQKDKVKCANALIQKLRTVDADATRVPQFFAAVIKNIIAKAAS
jgi:putative ATP-dependent endonuclease of OLD family